MVIGGMEDWIGVPAVVAFLCGLGWREVHTNRKVYLAGVLERSKVGPSALCVVRCSLAVYLFPVVAS